MSDQLQHLSQHYMEPDVHRAMCPPTRFIRLPLVSLEVSYARDFFWTPNGYEKKTRVGLHRSSTLDKADAQWTEMCDAIGEIRLEWEAQLEREHANERTGDSPHCDRSDCLDSIFETEGERWAAALEGENVEVIHLGAVDSEGLDKLSDNDLLNSFREMFTQAQDLHPGFRSCYECDPVMKALDAEIGTRGEWVRKRATSIGQQINKEVLGI